MNSSSASDDYPTGHMTFSRRFKRAGKLMCTLPALLFLFCACTSAYHPRPEASAGIIDLRQCDFSENPAFDLAGQWDFRWNELGIPDSFGAEKEFIRVPATWTESGRPVYGYATYRLTVLPPEIDSSLSLRIPPSDTAFTLFVNEKKAFSNGNVGTGKRYSKPLYYAPVRIELPRVSRIEIIVQMSNYDFPRPGMRDCLTIGRTDHLRAEADNYLFLTLFSAGAIFIMSMYHFGLYYQRKSDRSNLYFALLCICTLLRLLVTGEAAAYRFTGLEWETGSRIEYLSLAIWAVALLLIRSFFPAEISRRMMNGLFAIIAVLSACVIFTPVSVFTRLLPVFDVLSVFIIGYIFFVLTLTLIRKRESGGVFFAAFAFFAATVINDMLLGYRLINSVYIMPFGLVFVFFLQSYLLSSKFSKAFTAVEVLSRSLEERVIERTMELEVERDKLRTVNLRMEKEIDLARIIQERLIPLESPVRYISAVYNPMQQVGGDFFDFIRFDDPNRIGIFLCDVSGHGVPAAFITSMVKSTLLQAGDRKDNPAEMMSYLNEVLFNNTAGYFCTAFYGIYDNTERSITYASAGHCTPFIIDERGVIPFDGKTGALIGAFSNSALELRRRAYSTRKMNLSSGSKIVLYTDGMTEMRPMNAAENFFIDAAMHDAFMKHRSLPCGEFTQALFQSLVDFRGNNSFEDDIAIICVDVE